MKLVSRNHVCFGLGSVITLIMVFLVYFQVFYSSKQYFVYFCDVGQGDAILFQYGYFQMLVDAGPDEKVLECLSKVMPRGDINLEIAVLTHADKDHFQGFTSVLNQYLVGEMWIVPLSKEGNDFDEFRNVLTEQIKASTRLRIVQQGDVFQLNKDIGVAVLWPNLLENEVTETVLSDEELRFSSNRKWGNDLSIVLKITIVGYDVLLTGDIEKSAEQALVVDNLINQVDVLKVAHHGSKTSTSDVFLKEAQPEIAAVSSGANNQHGHPAESIISSLESIETTILRTDKLSTFGLVFEKESGIKIVEGD